MGADYLGIFINVGKVWKTGECEKFGYLIRTSQMTTYTMQICWGIETESRQEQFRKLDSDLRRVLLHCSWDGGYNLIPLDTSYCCATIYGP